MISRRSTIEGMNRPAPSSNRVTSTHLDTPPLPPSSSSARAAPPSRRSVERTYSVRCSQGISSTGSHCSSTADSSHRSLPLVPQLHHHIKQLQYSKPPLHFTKHREGMMNEVHASPIKRSTSKATGSTSSSAASLNSIRSAVRFAPDSEILYIPVPSLTELSHDDVTAQWWSPNEFCEHRVEYKATVNLMEQKEQHQMEEKQHQQANSQGESLGLFTSIEGSRGLEQRTEDGAWKYYSTKRTASEAVLAEQTRLRAANVAASSNKAVICIAHVYAQCAERAVKNALERARYDGDQVGIAVEFTTPIPPPAPVVFVGLLSRGMVKESTAAVNGKKKPKGNDSLKPPITPGRHRDKPPFQSKNPTRGGGGDDQHHANNQSLNSSLHSVTSRALQTRPRLVRETAVSQRHLLDSVASTAHVSSSTPSKSTSPLDGSRHSVTSTASRPRLRREYVISSKRDLLNCSVKDAASPMEYNLDVASLVPNSSQRSLYSISSQVSSSAARPKLRRETGVTSKKSLLDSNERGIGRGTSGRNFPSIIFTADDTNDTTPEGSQRSLNSISSQISSSSLRPRLRREPTASAKSILSSKSNKSGKSSSRAQGAKYLSQPPDAKEIVLPPRVEEPPVPFAAAKSSSRHLRKERKQALQLDESVDSFANSLESPLSTSVSSSSTRPGLRRQQSIGLKKRPLTMNATCATVTSSKDFSKDHLRHSNVRFVDKVVVLPCPKKSSEMGLSDKWLSPQELAEIQDRVEDVVAWMEQGIPVIAESNRGLENSTEVAQQELLERRRGACLLVLQRQAELRTSEKDDVDNLAELYKAATKEARTVAFVHAKLDTKDAQQHQSMYPCMI